MEEIRIRDYFEMLIEAESKLRKMEIAALKELWLAEHMSLIKQVDNTRVVDELAIRTASAAVDRRFESVNEFRSAMVDREGRFSSKDEVTALDAKISAIARLVYIGVGLILATQVLFSLIGRKLL